MATTLAKFEDSTDNKAAVSSGGLYRKFTAWTPPPKRPHSPSKVSTATSAEGNLNAHFGMFEAVKIDQVLVLEADADATIFADSLLKHWRRHMTLWVDSPFDKLMSEIERLKDGWAGPGSLAPPAKVIADVRTLIEQLPPKAPVPEADVDTDDGSVTLRWAVGGGTFSCVLNGTRAVIGVFSALTGHRAATWRCSLDDERALQRALESADVKTFIG